jgi:flagellar biosynthesis/type III secretory pathway protein FliH
MYISVEENVRIEFDRFFEAVKFNGFVIEDNLVELLEKLEENIIQEYDGQSDEIFKEGYDEGHDHGRDLGYEEGYSDGREIGQDEGFSEGLAEALENCNCKGED